MDKRFESVDNTMNQILQTLARIEASMAENDQITKELQENLSELNSATEAKTMGFVEIHVFAGSDLRRWIHWMESEFDRTEASEFQKLQMAHGFMEGKALQWYYQREFETWQDLKNELLMKFGKATDPERYWLLAEKERLNRIQRNKQRDSVQIKRTTIPTFESSCATTSRTEKELIREAETKVLVHGRDTNLKQDPIHPQKLNEEPDSTVAIDVLQKHLFPHLVSQQMEAFSHSQVPVSQLEPSLIFRNAKLQVVLVKINRKQSQGGFEFEDRFNHQEERLQGLYVEENTELSQALSDVKVLHLPHQQFDKMLLRGRRSEKQQSNQLKMSKSWMFKFKNDLDSSDSLHDKLTFHESCQTDTDIEETKKEKEIKSLLGHIQETHIHDKATLIFSVYSVHVANSLTEKRKIAGGKGQIYCRDEQFHMTKNSSLWLHENVAAKFKDKASTKQNKLTNSIDKTKKNIQLRRQEFKISRVTKRHFISYKRCWKYEFCVWGAYTWIYNNLQLLERKGVTIECRGLTSVVGCESQTVFKCDTWRRVAGCWQFALVTLHSSQRSEFLGWNTRDDAVTVLVFETIVPSQMQIPQRMMHTTGQWREEFAHHLHFDAKGVYHKLVITVFEQVSKHVVVVLVDSVWSFSAARVRHNTHTAAYSANHGAGHCITYETLHVVSTLGMFCLLLQRFQIKHKWRYKLLQPVSKLVFCGNSVLVLFANTLFLIHCLDIGCYSTVTSAYSIFEHHDNSKVNDNTPQAVMMDDGHEIAIVHGIKKREGINAVVFYQLEGKLCFEKGGIDRS